MKIAISLPDQLFEAGERLAAQLRTSRSQLYARALEAFLREHRGLGVREALAKVYGEEPSAMDAVLDELQAEALREDW